MYFTFSSSWFDQFKLCFDKDLFIYLFFSSPKLQITIYVCYEIVATFYREK